MYRAEKIINRVLDQKQKEKNYERHKLRMDKIRSVVDVSCPPSYKRSLSTSRVSKKEALKELRCVEIERHNRILLQKLTDIMTKEPLKSQQFGPRSLNRDKRKRDLVKITLENQAILNRIVSQKAQYSNQKWEQQRIKEEHMLQGLCQYPYQLGLQKSPQRAPPKFIKPLTLRNIEPTDQNNNYVQLEPERVIVYKKTKQLQNNNEYFLVEISKSEKLMHFVVHGVYNGKAYVLQIPIKQANRLLNQCDQKFDVMANKLQLVNGHLILKEKRSLSKQDNLSYTIQQKEIRSKQKFTSEKSDQNNKAFQ